MVITINGEEELDLVVDAYLAFAKGLKICFLRGDLGTGKTTFVKKLVKRLGSEEEASSPTYSLVNEYHLSAGSLYHIDLYRLNDSHEAQDMGIEEYLDSGAYCMIEWPDLIAHLVDQAVVIKIESLTDNSRKFEIEMLNA
jgi:tRNA threonylcarbamoyladenosine biosynthesis protein TsaE